MRKHLLTNKKYKRKKKLEFIVIYLNNQNPI